jgi:copper transporter 1
MLFTWDTQNLCIVFKSWRVTSTMSLFWSLLGVMALTAGYELIREISRRYEAKVQREIDDMPSKSYRLPIHPQHTCFFTLHYLPHASITACV